MIDMKGRRYGRLTVIEKSNEKGGNGKSLYWKCQCDCGNIVIVNGRYLRNGDTKSCGCKNHGMTGTRLYEIWKGIIKRCCSQSNKAYHNYGGRGITVCEEWLHDFRKFYDWAIANGYKEGLSIDRIDNNGNYEPSNCRWGTQKEQMNNTRKNHIITYKGETHTISEWADIVGICYNTLSNRINQYHWDIERALTEPVNKKYAHK